MVTDCRYIALEPGALGRFLGLLLGIIYAAFAMCGMEIMTLSVIEVYLVDHHV
jgi:hypothetical protein